MSHSSPPRTEAEPPFGDQPRPPEDELTLDLEEPGLADLTLAAAENSAAALDESAPDGAPGQTSASQETLDLSEATEETLVGCELQKGKYRVLSLHPGTLVGLPLLGASYTALHTDLQKRLTLRYLPLDQNASAEERDQTTMQFLREVRVLAKLDHPSLPRVHDYFCEGAACYVVMDEVSQRTLADVLAEASQEGRVPAMPPVMIAQLGLDLARALGYLHQQRPPLVLGGLRAEDIALPADGPAQLMSLGALSMVASVSSASLPGFASMPTLPVPTQMTKVATLADLPTAPEALAPARPPEPGDDLFGLGVLLRELAGGAEVVARVMDRLQRPDEALQVDGADDAPPISLALAGVIQIAAHHEPGRRFQNAAAFETALLRAWMVERRIVRQAERGRRDERATRLENGEDDLEATSLDVVAPAARQHGEMATRHSWSPGAITSAPLATICWRCGGHNVPGAPVCRVCGARQPVLGDQSAHARSSASVRLARPTRRLPPHALDEPAWAEWDKDEAKGGRDGGRRLLWGLVWACFVMAFLLGGATIVVTYLALH